MHKWIKAALGTHVGISVTSTTVVSAILRAGYATPWEVVPRKHTDLSRGSEIDIDSVTRNSCGRDDSQRRGTIWNPSNVRRDRASRSVVKPCEIFQFHGNRHVKVTSESENERVLRADSTAKAASRDDGASTRSNVGEKHELIDLRTAAI